MPIKNIEQRLDALAGDNVSNWRETFSERRKNRRRLRHSKQIALDINLHLIENGLNGKKLAEILEVSPQQVSKILKGNENLTLDTISKIEMALGIDLIFHNTKMNEVKPSKDKVLENDIDLQTNQISQEVKATTESELVDYNTTNTLSEVAEEGAEYKPE